ncbi:MAG: hypothetical protein KAU02_02725, partial [Tenericutes bacterium]|nr:hypothetical protein [Mycoplasmatota bacterium]
MKVSKKLLIMAVLFLASFLLVACGETTTEATTAAPTTVAPTTVAPTTVASTTAAPVDLSALIDDLKTHYADTLESITFVATEDLTLLASIGGVDIVWSSANDSYLEDDGTIHQPSFDLGDQTVVLTATMADGDDTESHNFFVTVEALAKTDQERADEVFIVVTAFPSKEVWTSADNAGLDFAVLGEDDDEVEYAIVWTSSHPEIISVGGEITQPDGANVDVTMTATITIATVDYTSVVVFTVAKTLEGTEYATIAALADIIEDDPYVMIPGLTVLGIDPYGNVFFTDGVNLIYVYSPSFTVEVGSVYDVTGTFTSYFAFNQLVGDDTTPLRAEPSTAAVSIAPIVDTVTVTELFNVSPPVDGTDEVFHTMYTITGTVYFDEEMAYPCYLVPSDYDFSVARTEDNYPNGTEYIEIYYNSHEELLEAFNGLEITIDVIYNGFHGNHENTYVHFYGEVEDVDVTFANDAEQVTTALAAVMLPAEIKAAETLELPTELFGVALTYASDDELVINTTTGAVDLTGLVTRQLVTVTVTGTFNSEVQTRDIEILVGELPLLTIAEAIAAGQDANVKVIGIITDTTDTASYGAFWLQDATGAFDLFNPSGVFTVDMIGKTYEFIGVIDVYNGLNELVVDSLDDAMELTGDDALSMPTAVDLSAMTLDDTTLLPYQGMLVDLTGFFLKYDLDATYTSSFNMYMINSVGEEIAVRIDKDVPGFASFVTLIGGSVANTPLDFTNVIVGWYNGAQILVPSDAIITVGTTYTDAELLAMDAAIFESDVTLSGDYMVPELMFSEVTTVVFSTELQPNLSYDSMVDDSLIVVTLPSVADLTGTITITLAYELETLDVVINAIIEAFTDADRLAADLAGLIAGAAEVVGMEYQMIALPILGNYGSVITWTLVSGTATLDVNELYLDPTGVEHDVVVEATLTLGSETPVTQQFTLTVTPVILVTDFTTLHDNTAGVFTIADETEVYVSGVVTGFGYHVVYIQDANGEGLYAYYGEGHENDGTINIGDEIIYFGELDSYNNVRRLGYGAVLHAGLSTGNAIIDDTVYTLDDVVALAIEDSGKIINVTGLVYKGIDGGKYQFDVVGTTTVRLEVYTSVAPEWIPNVFEVDDILPEVTFTFKEINWSGNLGGEMFTLEMTDQMMLDADLNAIPATMDMTEDYVILDGLYGSTMVVTGITGDAATYLDFTTTPGTILFTEPATDAVGVITLEVTQGTLPVETVTIDVTVK